MNDTIHNFFIKRAIFSLIIAAIALLGWFVWRQYNISKVESFTACQLAGFPIQESYPARCVLPNGKSFTQDIQDSGVGCTMEAKICPDGSAVGRVGPDCEFSTCPASN